MSVLRYWDGSQWVDIQNGDSRVRTCVIAAPGSQTFGNGSGTLTLTTSVYDPFSMRVGSTIVVNTTGIWSVNMRGVALVTPAGASTWNCMVLKNGVAPSGTPHCSTLMHAVGFGYHAIDTQPLSLVAGDALSIAYSINAGATATVNALTQLSATYMGPAA